jgi:hypothetical protein
MKTYNSIMATFLGNKEEQEEAKKYLEDTGFYESENEEEALGNRLTLEPIQGTDEDFFGNL